MKGFATTAGLVAGLAMACAAGTPALAGTPQWVVNLQEIAGYTPLEIKFGFDDSGSSMRLGAAVLYNDGSTNVIDVYNFSADANGVTVEDTFSSVASGDVFALGSLCLQDGVFIAPYIDNFDLRAIRWDDMQAWNVPVDTTAVNHTTSGCLDLGAGRAGITSRDFDNGEIDYYESFDLGVSWSYGFSYGAGADSISGPFDGAFRDISGAAPLMSGGSGLGLTYQLESGPIHSTLFDPDDGSILGGPVSWDDFAPHGSFIGNGSLKEMTGGAVGSLGLAFGAANGGTHIGLGHLDLNDGTRGFQLLNSVTTDALGFQGLALEYSWGPDNLFVHVLSNRHARLNYDTNTGAMTYETIPEYPFEDIGGPVGSAYANDRLYVGAPGFATPRGGQPTFQIATMNTDPSVMQGVPLGGPPDGPDASTQSVPTLGAAGLLALLAALLYVAWLRLRGT